MSEPVVHDIHDLPGVGPAAVCMGVFDGVHRGHRALAEQTVAAAHARGAASVALVFDPHPDEVVRPGVSVPRLASVGENIRRLSEVGIDHPLAVRFDAALRSLEPADFLAAMAPAIELRALVMTPESAFGRNRAGTPAAMRELGARVGFDLVLADRIVREGGAPISSARIRAVLADGDLDEVVSMLGHPLVLEAEAAAETHPGGGAPDGRTWRLQFGYLPALPAIGRHAVTVRRTGDGTRPVAAELEVGEGGAVLHAPDAVGGPITIEVLPHG